MIRKKDRKFKQMEIRLQRYKLLDIEINNLKVNIDDIESDINGCKAINYSSSKTSDTYKFNSSVENESLNRQSRVEYLNQKIKEKEIEKYKINNALMLLDGREKEFFDLYFMSTSKGNMSNVARNMHLDRSTCYLVKDKIVFKMIDFL